MTWLEKLLCDLGYHKESEPIPSCVGILSCQRCKLPLGYYSWVSGAGEPWKRRFR